MGLSVFDEKLPIVKNLVCTSVNSPGFNTVFGDGRWNERCDSIYVVNRDAIDHTIALRCNSGIYTTTGLGSVNVPAGAGVTPGVPPVDLIPAIFPVSLGFVCDSNTTLDVDCIVAPTGVTTVELTAVGGIL